jgi:biopolymer transport protein ExbD
MRTEPYNGQRRPRRYSTPVAEINIIPLVDVTLVLLIIFMATTAFVKDQDKKPDRDAPERELPLNLPSSTLAVNGAPSDLFVLSVDREGKKYIGTQPVTLTLLHQRVREVAAKTPQPRVRIDADKESRFQDVLEMIELCQFEGLKNVGIHTAPPK